MQLVCSMEVFILVTQLGILYMHSVGKSYNEGHRIPVNIIQNSGNHKRK